MPWVEWSSAATGKVPLPPARSLQWEMEIPAGESVDRVEVAMAEINLPPEVSSISVEDPGVVYLAAPPPSGPVIDAEHPDVSGIFTVIDEKNDRQANSTKGKKYYRVGYRTVSWKAKDPNEDALRFDLEVERRDGIQLPVRERIDGTQLAVDTTALPDGVYRFVLTATDAPQNPGTAMETEATSRWFTVDNTPPVIEIDADGEMWMVKVQRRVEPDRAASNGRGTGTAGTSSRPRTGCSTGPRRASRLRARERRPSGRCEGHGSAPQPDDRGSGGGVVRF